MKRNENLFPKLLGDFLSVYLPSQRGYSKNTISSYCDAFKLLLQYFECEKKLHSDQITFKHLDEACIVDFMDWLKETRKSSNSTVNQRLAGIHSFFKYVQKIHPELMSRCNEILTIQFQKASFPTISYLSQDDSKLILSMPDTSKKSGRRDSALLWLLYDTGCRVQEIVDLKVSSLRLEPPAQVKLCGKGNKARVVPLMSGTAKLLKSYISENNLGEAYTLQYPLFTNQKKEPLTRAGIAYILRKHASMASLERPTINPNISPHIIRHSKAMHLLEAGVNIVYIRDILGHADISTTEIYAKSNLEMKRKALEKVAIVNETHSTPHWTKDENLLSWLGSFSKSLN